MKVLVTGASGFTGSYTVPLLIEQGYEVICFVRDTSDLSHLPMDKVKLLVGDLNNGESILEALKQVDILINIASLGFGHASTIVNSAVSAGIERAVFFSTTSIFTTLNPQSKSIRLGAENVISKSNLAYTIIRPTMIYGNSRDRNICKFIQFTNRFPVFPVFGSGENKLQPVHVQDVADAVVGILRSESTIRNSYNISGGSVITLNELIENIARLLRKRIIKLHIPPKPFIYLLRILEKISIPLPIKSEQIQRLNEDKNFDNLLAKNDFGYSPRKFLDGLKEEIREIGLINE